MILYILMTGEMPWSSLVSLEAAGSFGISEDGGRLGSALLSMHSFHIACHSRAVARAPAPARTLVHVRADTQNHSFSLYL